MLALADAFTFVSGLAEPALPEEVTTAAEGVLCVFLSFGSRECADKNLQPHQFLTTLSVVTQNAALAGIHLHRFTLKVRHTPLGVATTTVAVAACVYRHLSQFAQAQQAYGKFCLASVLRPEFAEFAVTSIVLCDHG